VVAEYLRFFTKIGMKDPAVYNKIIKDLQNIQNDLKPAQIVEVLRSSSIMRIYNPSLFKFLSTKVIQFINQYRKDLPDILHYYSILL